MTTTLERAIEAVSNTASDYPDEENFEAVARAVLIAVREPDRKWTADVCEDLCEPELVFNPAPASAFTAIIDAILKEGER